MPVTETKRIPDIDEIIDAQLFANRLIERSQGWMPMFDFAEADRALLTDPQTSGGLLVACAPEVVDTVLAVFRNGGFGEAAVVGTVDSQRADKRLIVT